MMLRIDAAVMMDWMVLVTVGSYVVFADAGSRAAFAAMKSCDQVFVQAMSHEACAAVQSTTEGSLAETHFLRHQLRS